MRLTWVVVVFLFIFACSDNSAGPGDDNNGGGTEPTASATIGTEGGSISADGISLTVPEGSLNTESVIGIGETGENGFGENAASKTFLLTGIPADFSNHLSITIALSKSLSHETFLVVQTPAIDPQTGETMLLPAFYPVTANGDSVTALLQPRQFVPGKFTRGHEETNVIDFYLTLVTDYCASQGDSHFSMRAPWHARETMNSLLPHLDRTYDRIEVQGFDLSIPGNVRGTLDSIRVYTTENIPDPPVFGFINAGDDKMGYLLIDGDHLSQSELEEVKFDADRSLAFMTALYYTPADELEPSFAFSIAMADWLAREHLYTGSTIPLFVSTDPVSVLGGIPLLSGKDRNTYEDFCERARRLAPLFEYLHDEYGLIGETQGLSTIYKALYNGNDLETALESVTGKDSLEWWPDFVGEYITGQVWDVNPQAFLDSSAQKGQTTLSHADTTHTFFGSFGDLAADIYTITLTADYAEDISSLRFIAESTGLQDEYLNVVLFGIRNNKPYYIGRGIDSIIADAGEASDGNTYIAVVTSSLIDYPYRDDVPYSLTVTGTRGTNEISQIVLQLPYVWRSYEWVDNDGSTRSAGGAGGMFTWTLDDFEKDGNTYTGTIVTTSNSDFWGHYTKTATITAVITATEASAKIHQVIEDYDADSVTNETFEFWGLPLIDPVEGFVASYGSTLEQYLANEEWTQFTYTFHRIANVDPEGYTRHTEYSADRGANIHLR